MKHGVFSLLDKDTQQKVVNAFLNDCGDKNYSSDIDSAYVQVEEFVNKIKNEIKRVKAY